MNYADKLSLAKSRAFAEGATSEEWERWQTTMRLILSRIGLTAERVHAMTLRYYGGAK